MFGTLCALIFLAVTGITPVTTPTGYVRTHDVDIAYWTYGSARGTTPVIVANGGPGLSYIYMMQNDLWLRVARTRQVVVYDQRGTGHSDRMRRGAPQTMGAQVADLDAVRAHLGFGRFDLVGDSYGGLLAMAYTAAHPDRVDKLVLSDSAAPAWNDIVHLLPDVFPDIEAQDAHADPQTSLRNHFRMIFYSPEKRDAYLAGAQNLEYSPAIGSAVFAASKAIDLWPQLHHFACPTLVITGRFDLNVAPITAFKIAHAIPHAHVAIFERSGHLPAYEEPDRYVTVLESFLDR
jgi:proline iminopeptidase